MPDAIKIFGARQHNLKGFDLEIPRNSLTVITGLSGSDKSSIAFDTLYAEGQRRYVESLSAYARLFLDIMQKPQLDHIEGFSSVIAIEQRTASSSPRSIVATPRNLRLPPSSLPHVGTRTPEMRRTSPPPIRRRHCRQILELRKDARYAAAPYVNGRKGEHAEISMQSGRRFRPDRLTAKSTLWTNPKIAKTKRIRLKQSSIGWSQAKPTKKG